MAKKPSLDDVWGMGEDAAPRRVGVPRGQPVQQPKTSRSTAVSNPAPSKTTKPKRTAPRKTIKPPVEEKPVRLTLYLDPAVVELIDRSQLELKKQTGIRGHAISNSAIVEECVKLVLEQFLKRGSTSDLPSLISKRNAERAKKKGSSSKK